MSIQSWSLKLKQFHKVQKTTSIHYTILKTLTQAFEQQPQKIPLKEQFQFFLKSLPKQIKSLHLYKKLIYQIWKKQYQMKIRQECTQQILKIVTQWIMIFQINVDKLNLSSEKFRFLREFIQRFSTELEWSILVILQIYEDLKDLFNDQFWIFQMNKFNQKQPHLIIKADDDTPFQILALLQILMFRQIQQLNTKDQISLNISNRHFFTDQKYNQFIIRCIFYILNLNLDQNYQSQATKYALQFMRSIYCIKNKKLTINLLKTLMTRTKKSVRYAMVSEYVQIYNFFNIIQCYQIIQEIQQMIFFRQLIIGKSKITNNQQINSITEIISQYYFSPIYIKAGSKQRIFFSFQDSQKAILKFQLILDEGMDITLKFYHMSNNQKQIIYHEEQKTKLRRIELNLIYTGLYAIEFDNSYSWIQGKKILYHLHLFKKLQEQQLIEFRTIINQIQIQ